MARSNIKTGTYTGRYSAGTPALTHEGAPAIVPEDKELLRRLVLSCLLWEDNFYIDGKSVAEQISTVAQRIAKVDPNFVRDLVVETRNVHNLRHVSLWILVALAQAGKLKKEDVYAVVNRPDEMAELISLYWKANKREGASPKKLSKAVQNGVGLAFTKFDAYQLAKWNRDKDISLKDVMFLTHPKALSPEQAEVWSKLVAGTLEAPDTWEVNLSAGKDKKETWERLLSERKLGFQALLMNLRNMRDSGVDERLVFESLRRGAGRQRMLPFQFINAAKHVPQWESVIEEAMLSSLQGMEKLSGKSVLVVDVSGSMSGRIGRASKISAYSELQRVDAAAALAALMREVCEDVRIFITGTKTAAVPDRHGFALMEYIKSGALKVGGGGIYLTECMDYVQKSVGESDRVIVFTDEQDCGDPSKAKTVGKVNYINNVATYEMGIAYGKKNWTHVNGFSDSIIKFIHATELGG